jgi:ribonuclease HI
LHHPDSLCARLLKARYYPSGDLLDTAFIQNQSQSWQGVLYGLELLKKGIIWRIGNGTKVRIFRDNWIPRCDALKVQGKRGNSRRRWVSELISPETRTWDEAAVQACCFPIDADAILNIKLPARACDDFVAWSAESNGLFSVRSAYRLGLQPIIESLNQGQSSGEPTGDRRAWDLVWKASVPQKLRIFAWRAAAGNLAVRVHLHRRILTVDPTCSICGMEVESDHHALVTCTLARALRDELREAWSLPSEEIFMKTGKEWLLHLLSCTAKESRAKVIFLLWRVWHHRNNVVHGDGKASISSSVSFLVNYHQSFAAVSAGTEASLTPSWSAPPTGQLKANVDAGWVQYSKNAGIGIIIRDHMGLPVLSEWKHIPNCASAEDAEILACLEGLKHLISLRRWPAILETDCMRAAAALSSNLPDQSNSWALISEGRELLRVYKELQISKANRVNNGVAHVLAQLGKSGCSGISWGPPPSCVSAMVDHDCKNIM